jgi:5-oxoprolinase (ATP-hydrolysing)
MTNTRITDPEILEFRHPGVRLEQFTVRTGSGGRGKFPGGDGVIREIKFLKPSVVSIISERRRHAPYGIRGGKAGKRGRNYLKTADGQERELGHRDVVRVRENDSIVIETPGGGGYGNIPGQDREQG